MSGLSLELKKLSREGISSALAKAERYRLLNQPLAAESICRDILLADPENQDATIMLLLCITDQFRDHAGVNISAARALLPQLQNPYHRAYYQGVVFERWAKAQLVRPTPAAGAIAFQFFREAMDSFEQAEKLHSKGNDESILHWNVCARLIMANNLSAHDESPHTEPYGDY